MPNNNQISDHYQADEVQMVKDLFQQIEDIIRPRARNLSPDERKQFGSVHEQAKLFIQKDMDYHANQPELSCPDVNWPEQTADWADRKFLADVVIAKCQGLQQMADNTRILHDYDAYKNAIADYQFTKYKFENTGESNWETKYNDLKELVGGAAS